MGVHSIKGQIFSFSGIAARFCPHPYFGLFFNIFLTKLKICADIETSNVRFLLVSEFRSGAHY